MTLKEQLKSLDREIRVAIIGIGSIGKGLVYQSHLTHNIRPVAIADLNQLVNLRIAWSMVFWRYVRMAKFLLLLRLLMC